MQQSRICWLTWVMGLISLRTAWGYDLDPEDATSVKTISQKIAFDMMEFYPGNHSDGIPGLFGDPYYWYEAGAVFGSLINYWYITGDEGYVNTTSIAMLHQVGDEKNYMPANQSKSLGNDDQCFWGMTAMIAAEYKFPDPPSDKPQWLALAQAVFNSQARRWDTASCGGGLRWQIYSFNEGYNYKNTVSNGCFFHMAARLARYTGNSTYADWAVKAYDWVKDVGLISDDYAIYDGFSNTDTKNCTSSTMDQLQWTYNNGFFLLGSAMMYNYTNGSSLWRERTDGLLNATDYFFQPPSGPANTLYEPACETNEKCDTDEQSFKAYLLRSMALTAKVAPFTNEKIMSYFYTTGKNAALSCSGGDNGNTCGLKWTTNGTWDSEYGIGEQMAGLEAVQNNLINTVAPPYTAQNGGTSKGNPSAGTGGDANPALASDTIVIHTGDRVGAGFATVAVIGMVLGGSAWLMIG